MSCPLGRQDQFVGKGWMMGCVFLAVAMAVGQKRVSVTKWFPQATLAVRMEAGKISINVCLYTLDFKPRMAIRFFFARLINLLLLPLVITFLPPLSFSLLHDVKRTSERANGRTDGNSPLLTSISSFAYHY
jgi:hypothetical protein